TKARRREIARLLRTLVPVGYWRSAPPRPHFFGTRPASDTTFAHFSMSARRYLSNSAGDIDIGLAPCFAHAALTSGRAITLRISALSVSTPAFGVFAGAITPSQMVDW